MNAPPRRPMTLDRFLDWESRQPPRCEFDGVQAIAMTEGTTAHAMIQVNLAIAVGGRLRGKAYRFINGELKIEVAGRIRYPDGFVYCSPFEADKTVITDPVVIFEVLSDGASQTDTITKNAEYAQTPSVRRHVMLARNARRGAMFERGGEAWVGHPLTADSTPHMPEIEIEVPLAEVCVGVEPMVSDDSLRRHGQPASLTPRGR